MDALDYPTPMEIPTRPYVALYGSHAGDWRRRVAGLLRQHGVPFFDPTDRKAWARITPETGDARQGEVDTLVEKQRRALLGASAVIFHLARAEGNSPAARVELGYLMGLGTIPVYLYVAPDCAGRNYVWAQARLSPTTWVGYSLKETAETALLAFRGEHAPGP